MGRNHDFLSKLFCFTRPKLIVEETLCAVLQKFSCNDYGHEEEEYQDIPSKTICLTNVKKFRRGHLCFKKILVSKILMDKRGERDGVSRFSTKKDLSQSDPYFPKRIL